MTGLVWYDDFLDKVLTKTSDGLAVREWTDEDDTMMTIDIQRRCGLAKSGINDVRKAVQAHAHLVLQEFAHRAHAAVAEMVDVIKAGSADIELQVDQVIDGAEHVLRGEGAHRIGDGEAQLLVAVSYTHLTLPTTSRV